MDIEDYRELAGHWEIHLRNRNLSPKTIRAYIAGAHAYAGWCERNGTGPDLSLRSAEAFTAHYIEAGRSASTATLRQLAVKLYSAWLAAQGEIVRDELSGLRPPKRGQKVVPALGAAQYKALLAACSGTRFVDMRDRAIVMLMADSTARADEVLAMRTWDLQPLAGSAVVVRGKGGRGRRVGYSDKTAEALSRYVRARKRHPLAGRDELWLAEGRRVLGYQALYQTLRRRAARAGIEGFHPHQLRHTAAVRWLHAGGTPLGLKAMGGWRDWNMIERYIGSHAEDLAIAEARRLDYGD